MEQYTKGVDVCRFADRAALQQLRRHVGDGAQAGGGIIFVRKATEPKIGNLQARGGRSGVGALLAGGAPPLPGGEPEQRGCLPSEL